MRDPFDESVRDYTGIKAVACQDYAGAFSCGARQEGFEIVGKVEQKDRFGLKAWLHNADWLAGPELYYDWGDLRDWEKLPNVDVVFGNPPCSGFSQLTAGAKWQAGGLHGVEAKQNACMWDLVGYGAKLRASVVVFESVSHAATTGRKLMERLHDALEDETGDQWHLTYVKMNAMSVGGFPDRRRFFFVASRLGPVAMPHASGLCVPLSMTIGDLQRRVDFDDELSPYSLSPAKKAWRNRLLAEYGWEPGRPCSEAYEKAVANGYDGPTPDRSDLILNSFTSWRWRWDKPARVATGAVLDCAVHPTQPRTFTHAEVGRIMGFPSQYDLRGITKLRGAGRKLYGKGIPAQAGRWVMEGVREHLTLDESDDHEIPDELERPREYVIDVTNRWKQNMKDWEQLDIWAAGA